MPRTYLCCIAASILTLIAVALPVHSASFTEKQRILSVVDQKMRLDGIPGLTLSVVDNGELVWEHAIGLANIEHAVEATPNTVFRSASLVKPITSTAILQLSVNGKIDLDEPVWKYCDNFPEKQYNVTSRDLLSHTAGIRSYSMPWTRYEAELFSAKRYKSVSDALTIFSDDPLIHKPRSAFKYSSYGYNLLGCVIESVSGMSYEQYLQKHIFEPANMHDTFAEKSEEVILNRAGTYRRGKKGVLTNERYVDLTNKIPSGGLLTTASDMARFSVAYMNGSLLPPSRVKDAIQPTLLADGTKSYYGMGWDLGQIDKTNLGSEMYHNGSTPGASSIMYLLPNTNSAVVVFGNLYGVGNKEELVQSITEILKLRQTDNTTRLTSSLD